MTAVLTSQELQQQLDFLIFHYDRAENLINS